MNTRAATLLIYVVLLGIEAHGQTFLLDAPGKGYEAQKQRVTVRTDLITQELPTNRVIEVRPKVDLPTSIFVPAAPSGESSILQQPIRLFSPSGF